MHYKQLHSSSWLVGIALLIVFFVIWRTLLQPGVMATHDGENHLARFANYYLAVKQGQIPPRFAPNLLNRYGYPVFNFNYPLANIASLPFSILQINYEITFKLIILASIATGSIGVYCWLRQLKHQILPTSLALAAYLSSPYILSAVLFRGSIGEVLVYGLLPWLFWLVEWMKHSSRQYCLIVGIPLVSALLLAHNVTGLIAAVLLGIYAISVWGKRFKLWQTGGILLLFSLGFTLWFWLPALVESSSTVIFKTGIQFEYLSHLVSIRQLLFSPVVFGYSIAGPVDVLSMSIGYASLMTLYATILVGTCWVIWRVILYLKRDLRVFQLPSVKSIILRNQKSIVLVVISLCLLYGQTIQSQAIWVHVSFLRFIQFPWRLTLFVPILLLPIFALLLSQKSYVLKSIVLAGLGIQLLIAMRVIPIGWINRTNIDYEQAHYSSSTQNENRAQSFNYDYPSHESEWQPSAEVLEGDGKIEHIKQWSGSSRQYILTASSPVVMVEPTMNFAGWQTTSQNLDKTAQKIRIPYVDSADIGGRIAYELPAGHYQITTRFTQNTPARKVGNILFVITVIGYGYVCWQCIRLRRKI